MAVSEGRRHKANDFTILYVRVVEKKLQRIWVYVFFSILLFIQLIQFGFESIALHMD